jgi:hypothetical protein
MFMLVLVTGKLASKMSKKYSISVVGHHCEMLAGGIMVVRLKKCGQQHYTQ